MSNRTGHKATRPIRRSWGDKHHQQTKTYQNKAVAKHYIRTDQVSMTTMRWMTNSMTIRRLKDVGRNIKKRWTTIAYRLKYQ